MPIVDLPPFAAALVSAYGIVLAIAAWFDLRYRAIPRWVVAICLVGASMVAINRLDAFTVERAPVFLFAPAVLAGAFALGIVAVGDVIIGAPAYVVLASFDMGPGHAIISESLKVSLATVTLWYVYRAGRSIRYSGLPRNRWDLAALGMGRLEREPNLMRYDRNREPSHLRDTTLAHIEAFRSADGFRLASDPCPLVTCYFVGYLGAAYAIVSGTL